MIKQTLKFVGVIGIFAAVYLWYAIGIAHLPEIFPRQQSEPTIKITIDKALSFDTWDYYVETVMLPLQAATEGQTVEITYNYCPGGLVSLQNVIGAEMSYTKAHVVSTFNGFNASSCGYLPFMADTLVIRHDTLFMWHQGFIVTNEGWTRLGRKYMNIPWLTDADVRKMERLRLDMILTHQEMEEFKDGEDVWLSGQQICTRLAKEKLVGYELPLMVKKDAQRCIIKGAKSPLIGPNPIVDKLIDLYYTIRYVIIDAIIGDEDE